MPTVLHRLARWAETDPQAPAQRFKKNGQWQTITAKEYMDRVYSLALFLESRGLTSNDVGCIFSPNNPQWVHVDLATLLVGAKSAGIYPNSIDKDIHYVLNHTETKVLSIANKEFYEKVGALPERITTLLVLDDDTSFHKGAIGYDTAVSEGRKLAQAGGSRKLSEFLARLDPKEGAFMIYTSGTTGNPKGALLSHDNLTFTSDIAAKYWKLPYARGSLFSFLPLCHVAEKLQSIGVGISQRYTVNYATKFEAVSQELPEIQPLLLLCVPRLWEKMMEGVMTKVKGSKGVKKELALWALGVGARVADAKYSGKTPNPIDLAQLAIANQLVLKKIRHALGIGQSETLASGAAALPSHVSKWFRSLDAEILEDYGQTESTGVVCMTERGVESAGTVGRPVPGLDFKIAEDGEILTRGRHVFVGYFKNPQATADTFKDGWLCTGDLGELTDKGLVKIRGRKKEILKTSGGKMVAPLPIEEKFKGLAPIVSQICMVGDNRKFLSAVITLSEPKMKELQAKNPAALSAKVVNDPATNEEVKKYIDELNKTLSGYEQIKKFSIIAREFSIADGEMTPTLKMKRNIIEKNFADVIESMY
jgi:long-chain acyl-CoA synthetase